MYSGVAFAFSTYFSKYRFLFLNYFEVPCSTGKIIGPSVFFFFFLNIYVNLVSFYYTLIRIKLIWWGKSTVFWDTSVRRLLMLGLSPCLRWCWNTIVYCFKNLNQLQNVSVCLSSVGCLEAYTQVQILTTACLLIEVLTIYSYIWVLIWEQVYSLLKAVSLMIKTNKIWLWVWLKVSLVLLPNFC